MNEPALLHSMGLMEMIWSSIRIYARNLSTLVISGLIFVIPNVIFLFLVWILATLSLPVNGLFILIAAFLIGLVSAYFIQAVTTLVVSLELSSVKASLLQI